MAEIIGFTASIIAVIQLTAKATSLGYTYISGVKRASDDLHQLVNELSLFGKVLTILQKVADSNSQLETLEILNKPMASESPLQTCKTDLRRLIAKLEPCEGSKAVMKSFKFPFKEKEIFQHIERIERHKNTFMLALNADHISLSKDIKMDVQEIKVDFLAAAADIRGIKRKFVELDSWTQKEDAARTLERRKEVLQWIHQGAIDKKHKDINRRRKNNTGEWILRAPEFVEWNKENTSNRLLWAYGIPGAGKTFLSSVVIAHLLSQTRTRGYGVAYIYFDYKERSQQEPTSILASILKQLTSQLKSLPEKINALFMELDREAEPSLEELLSALISISRDFPQVFIALDALDECDPKAQRKDLLPLFHQMAEAGIHLFITSRPHPEDINCSFKFSAKIELWAKDEDIKNYIEQKIDEHPRARSLISQKNYKDKIISELIGCAKGMFLLVHFHIEYLCQQPTVKKVLEELTKLKGSSIYQDGNLLKPTYDRAIETILIQPKNCVELATRTLSWLTKARQTLTVRELQLAVSVDHECTTFDEMGVPERNTLLGVCASLVIIDEKSDTIKLAHYTVQEYLITSPITRFAASELAIACTTFLSYDIFAQVSRNPRKRLYELYPFLVYAATWLPAHLATCDETLTTEFVLRFLRSSGNISSYLHARKIWSPRNRFHKTHSRLEVQPLDLQSQGETQLFIAVSLGHSSVVQLLLEEGANIEVRGRSERTILQQAVFLKHEPMVQLLLEKGANIEARSLFGTTLHQAVFLGHEPMVQLLLEKGANIEARGFSRRTTLQQAVFLKHGSIIQLLLEKGADTEARDSKRKTALHNAVSLGDISLVQLLLDKGTNIEARGPSERTALHQAISLNHEALVWLLLERGADIEANDESGTTPLRYALSLRNEHIARLLLIKGAKSSSMDMFRSSTLQRAANYYPSLAPLAKKPL